MGMAIVILNNQEEFLQFLDPELCTLVETHEDGLRTLSLEYKFQDLHDDKQLFRIGNKVWVSGDTNLTDCLYVINTPVTTDVYQENKFQCDAEEVLVELNYAPLISQNYISTGNGFKITTTNGQKAVTINWNALNILYGEYYNIGVVQKCLNEDHNKVTFQGTSTLMGFLRQIEEETGNVFVTRYEKDITNNTIHRYLDFLNPINVSKDWTLNIEYDFITEDTTDQGVFDSNGDPTTDEDEYADTETQDDLVTFPTDTPIENIDPTTTSFRITNKNYELLNSDGDIYIDDGVQVPLEWESSDIGFDGTVDHVVISLSSVNGVVGLTCNNKSFVVPASENIGSSMGQGFVAPADENDPEEIGECAIPDDSLFTFYNTETERYIYSTTINREIGTVHEEILDFGFNIENVVFETDESETFTAIAPILSLEDNDTLSRSDLGNIISAWQSLEISKGDTIPMIVEKVNVQASSLSAAMTSLGTYSLSSNYYTRPYHPQDNIDTQTASNSTWEFWRATAYWKAPFTKHAGDLHVLLDNMGTTEYTGINARPDVREPRPILRPKIGTMETTEEDIYSIYNGVAMKLKDHMIPSFNIEVDVANLRDGQFNQYQLHDKVYVKLPDYTELVTARVVKTSKEAHDVAKNTLELSNYNQNNIKNVQCETYINASNSNFKYPYGKDLTVRLVNADYDSSDDYSIQYPANKLLTFTLYNVTDGNTTLTRTSYTKLTNANGYATINMKYDPGDYELVISFGGDEEYLETSITVDVSVGGVKEVDVGTNTQKLKPSDLTKQKTTAKNKKNVQTKKRFYSKYGVSPDGKYIMAVGRPSASGELAEYGYKFYKTVFYRKCPFCGSKELYWNIFWTSNENGNYALNPAVGRKKSGSAEGEITCKKCDADFSIFGKDKATTPRKNLKVYKKAVKSSKTEAYTLKKGKMYYDTIQISNRAKANEDNKTRTTSYTIPASVKKQALSIVGNSTGLDAAKKIAKWCGTKKNLRYENYANFRRGPTGCLNKHKSNCCDSTRLMLTMMEAAGCSTALKLQYVHVHNSTLNIGHVFAKITTRATGKYRYVDPVLKIENGRNPWGNHLKGYGPIVAVQDYNGPNNSPF